MNWPDLRRDYDRIISSLLFLVSSSELTWFEKGLRQSVFEYPFHRSPAWVNWPDLRRDYDLKNHSHSCWLVKSELTWFEKGLRPYYDMLHMIKQARVNWPDLRRDYDSRVTNKLLLRLFPQEWIDLIWEGITTRWLDCVHQTDLSGVNWPDLRRDYDVCRKSCFSANTPGVNWPDLRRDYDPLYIRMYEPELFQEWIDLIWEGITTGFFSIYPNSTSIWVNWPDLRRDYDKFFQILFDFLEIESELTWFEKGLRQFASALLLDFLLVSSELTWFEKGLRHIR